MPWSESRGANFKKACLAEYKKQRRMEIDIQIAALLNERDAL
jgi:hypothetical protein